MKDRTALDLYVGLYIGGLTSPLVPLLAELLVSVGGDWIYFQILGFAATSILGFVAARSYSGLVDLLVKPSIKIFVVALPLTYASALLWTAFRGILPAPLLYPSLFGLSSMVLASGLLTIAGLLRDRQIKKKKEQDASWTARYDPKTRRWMTMGGVIAFIVGLLTLGRGLTTDAFTPATQSSAIAAGILMLLVGGILVYISRKKREFVASEAGLMVGDDLTPWEEFEGYIIRDNAFIITSRNIWRSDRYFDANDVDIGEVRSAVSDYLPSLDEGVD